MSPQESDGNIPLPHRIRIDIGEISLNAVLNETETAKAIALVLPLESIAEVWPDRDIISFKVPMEMPEENAREYAETGDLGYWADGALFCIFFSPPVQVDVDDDHPTRSVQEPEGERMIRLSGPINIIGHLEEDIPPLIEDIATDDPIHITLIR